MFRDEYYDYEGEDYEGNEYEENYCEEEEEDQGGDEDYLHDDAIVNAYQSAVQGKNYWYVHSHPDHPQTLVVFILQYYFFNFREQ